jgi:UDP-N-acetylglucosamine acyltransferase
MATVHPTAVMGRDVQVGEDAVIGPYCVIGNGVSIGAGTVLQAHIVVSNGVTIGRGNHVFPHCMIGGCPQVLGLTPDSKLGTLVIGDGNVIRENVTIHTSKFEGAATQIGSETLLMVGSHVGHDCVIGDKVVLSNSVQIAGHVHIETGAWLAGMAGCHQFVTIGRWSFVAGLAGVNRDIPPFLIVSGHYPPTIRGVNKRGLLRAGLSQEQQDHIYEAYLKLYRRGGTLLANARELAEQDGLDENVRDMLQSIFRSTEHRFGRYLESLREH